jgi:choline dehydrogenase-like flavoprotein
MLLSLLLPSLLAFRGVGAAVSATDNTYDFVIIGAGTSGLVVANRLSELQNITVAVIEAGDSVFDNRNVTYPDAYGLALGSDIDWYYQTAKQTHADGRKQRLNAGKAIGGTSTINGRPRPSRRTYVRTYLY